MSDNFELTRLQSRIYRAKHLPTGQVFELRGKQGVHYWTAHEVIDDKAKDTVFADNWVSKKQLLPEIEKKLGARKAKEARAQAKKKAQQELLQRAKGPKRIKPYVYAQLKKQIKSSTETLLLAVATGQRFIMRYEGKSEGYRINFQSAEHDSWGGGKQAICRGMPSEEAALLELYYYLDVDITPELEEDYQRKCFVKS